MIKCTGDNGNLSVLPD